MNGQSDSTNGRNNVYDEMIDDLCEADGSDRLEYWRQIVSAASPCTPSILCLSPSLTRRSPDRS